MIKKLRRIYLAVTKRNNFLLSRVEYFHISGLRLIILLFLSISFLLFFVDPVFARAGGGEGFSGGGGGGSGGDGGGSLFFLLYFAFRYPIIGIPLLIIVAVFMYYSSKSARSGHMTRTIRKGYSTQQDRAFQESVEYIKDKDSEFSELPLIEKAKKVFIGVQKAWEEQNMRSVRHLVSDGIYERFSLQLEIQKNSLVRNIVNNINIISAKLVAIESDHYFDTVHIMITASSIDYYERTDNGKQVSGNIMQAEPFTEYWSFLRRPGAKTLSGAGLTEGCCPNCGTPLELSDSIICPSCKAIINSGEYDWVLAEITQASEWRVRPTKMIMGMDKLCEKDPAFNVQHIEDRVSVMFYRNIASQFFADTKYISKLANNEFLSRNKNRYTPLQNGKHEFYADAAVGTIEIAEVNLGNGEDMDTIRVKVKWAGHKENATVPSFISPDFRASHIFTQDYILNRKSTALTSAKNTLTSTHCPGCGSPESIDSSGNCAYCGIALNNGSLDWVLTKIQAFTGFPQFVSQYESFQHSAVFTEDVPALSKFDNESIVSCAVAIMLSDGVIDEKEQALLEKMAFSKGISSQKLAMIIKTVQEKGLHIPNPETTEAAQEFLKCMIRMCLADGKVTSSEQIMLKQLVAKMGYTDIDINMMIKKERTRLYSKAKTVIKQ